MVEGTSFKIASYRLQGCHEAPADFDKISQQGVAKSKRCLSAI